MGYSDRPQSKEKIEKKAIVYAYFDLHGGTIAEISEATGVSRSTVQRYLAEFDDPDKLRLIKDYLKSNIIELVKVGKISDMVKMNLEDLLFLERKNNRIYRWVLYEQYR